MPESTSFTLTSSKTGAKIVPVAEYEGAKVERLNRVHQELREAGPGGSIAALARRVAAADAKGAKALDLIGKHLMGGAALNRVPVFAKKVGPIEPVSVVPDPWMPEGFDPVFHALAHAYGAEALQATDNEGSAVAGQADTDFAGTLGLFTRFTVLECQLASDSDEPGPTLATMTINMFDDCLDHIGILAEVDNTDATANHAQETVAADATQILTFNHPNRGHSKWYWHLCTRPATIGRIVPAIAIVANMVADASAAAGFEAAFTDRTFTVDWRSLGGANCNVTTRAITPFSQGWDEYLSFARAQKWTRI